MGCFGEGANLNGRDWEKAIENGAKVIGVKMNLKYFAGVASLK